MSTRENINELYLTPMHTVPKRGPEAATYAVIIRALPATLRTILAGSDTAELINRLQQQFGMSADQRYALAEFVRDIIIGVAMPDDLVNTLAERVSIDGRVATQLIKEIDNQLLSKVGLGISGVSRSYEGPTIIQGADRMMLRYRSVDDLLASVEDYATDDRISFLDDAKQDNRILVLKALSQLKLSTDKKGKPFTFSELVDRDAPDFNAQDWVDIASEEENHLQRPTVQQALMAFMGSSDRLERLVTALPTPQIARTLHAVLQEALGRAKPALVAHVRLSPYFAGVYDKEQGINEQQFSKFVTLPENIRRQLSSADLSGAIGRLVQDGTIPEQYAVAVAKTIFLVEVGDLSVSVLPELFGKRLGLTPEQGRALAQRISGELLTSTATSEEEPEPEPTPEVEPLEDEPTPGLDDTEPAPDQKRPERSNVVDLRQRP